MLSFSIVKHIRPRPTHLESITLKADLGASVIPVVRQMMWDSFTLSICVRWLSETGKRIALLRLNDRTSALPLSLSLLFLRRKLSWLPQKWSKKRNHASRIIPAFCFVLFFPPFVSLLCCCCCCPGIESYLLFFQLNLMILSRPCCARSYGCLRTLALLTLKQVKVTETNTAV